jgi:LEA14-like dessication related protein
MARPFDCDILVGMSKASRRLLPLIGVGLIWLSGCIEPKSPVVTPQVTRVTAVMPSGLDLALTLRVDNPNDFPLAVHRVKGTVFIGQGKRLGESSAQPSQWIAAKQSGIVQSSLRVPWEQLPALSELVGRTQVPYRVVGDVTIGGESLNVTVPYEMSGQLSTQQLLAAGLRGLSP